MKNQYKIFVFLMLVMGVVSSCSEDKELKQITDPNEVDAPSITTPASGDSFVLTMDSKEELAMVVRWDRPDFGIDVKIDFSVDIDVKGGDFSDPINLAITNYDTLAITQEDLNTKVLELGLPTDEAGEIDIRVSSVVNYQIEEAYSEILTLNVTPYSTIFPSIYMIGAGTGGWDTALAVEVASTGEMNKYYTKAYFVSEGDGNFRFFSAADWGSSLGGWDIFTNYPTDYLQPKEGDGDPNFQFIGTTGWYELWVDSSTGTIEMSPTDEPNLYLVGNAAGGWNFDDPLATLKWVGHQIWEADVDFTKDGAFRFFGQMDWGPDSYGHDVFTEYSTDYIIIAEDNADPNWYFVAESGSYHVVVNMREASVEITAN